MERAVNSDFFKIFDNHYTILADYVVKVGGRLWQESVKLDKATNLIAALHAYIAPDHNLELIA